MNVLTLIVISAALFGLCALAMAVGVILRNKTFTSCGCASISYRGEKIRCPGCRETGEDACQEGTTKEA